MSVVKWEQGKRPVRKRAFLVRYCHMTDGDGARYFDDAVFLAKDYADLVFVVGAERDIRSVRELGPVGHEPFQTYRIGSSQETEWRIDDEQYIWWQSDPVRS